MASSLFNTLGGNNSKLPAPFGNMQELIGKLNQFGQSFQGDPKQQVQQLLNSGKMSQSQYNQYRQMAQQFKQILPKY